MKLSDKFSREADAETKRELIQITYESSASYPLYYFIPSITEDNRYIVYHSLKNDDVQLYATNLQTGEIKQLTHANDSNPSWKVWCSPVKSGVLDHRSALNVKTNDAIYIENNNVHSVNIDTLEDELLFTIPKDRRATGQNCVTPDGKWFVYIHHDLKLHNKISTYKNWEEFTANRRLSRQTVIAGFNLLTYEHKDILIMDSYFHHVFALDNEHFVINHPANEAGMYYTSLNGNWCTHLRTQNRDGRKICHCTATQKGIAYEATNGKDRVAAGIYNPINNNYSEFLLPRQFGYTHTGVDPDGDLFFYENINTDNNRNISHHDMYYLDEIEKGECSFKKIIGNRTTYAPFGQKSHFHPRMTDDREYIIFTGGCPKTKTNQIYFIDAKGLGKTKGLVYP